MSNRHPIPPADGVARVWPSDVGHTTMFGPTTAGKTAYNLLRVTAEAFRIIRGDSAGDGRDAGDEACA
ncbi:hypothetical protein [Burkholderia sp. Ac-20353]|uniref:hypothetical protein n=1 Tax=Burkholderia sp. Ac-20353 TaxID=2703894 RepID=UPI00197B868F|nr:hypothetical protein [Burkholderia sp. Ac-20353]MBN3786107.1 hypothetical protein [Burkholderia sp. Ac-20353]